MKLRIKRQNAIVNEDDVATAQSITDPDLLRDSMQLQNEKQKLQDEFNKVQADFNKKQEVFNKKVKVINDKLSKLMKKQEEISKKNNLNQNGQPQQTESLVIKMSNNRLFESTTKRSLLIDAITKVLSDNADDFSYDLSSDEIRRMARKINDFLSDKKNEEITWVDDVRHMIKNYVLKHNTISWSQSEINDFNDLLEEELLNDEIYDEQFGKYM